jgi:ATP/maltotriose-dependent transcriptional regulator MalT
VGFDITPQGIKRTADISRDEAVDMVRQLEAQARQEFVRGYLFALIYAGLGDKTKAIDYLKREYLDHDNINPTHVYASMLCLIRCKRSAVQGNRGEAPVNHNSVAIKVTALAHVR